MPTCNITGCSNIATTSSGHAVMYCTAHAPNSYTPAPRSRSLETVLTLHTYEAKWLVTTILHQCDMSTLVGRESVLARTLAGVIQEQIEAQE